MRDQLKLRNHQNPIDNGPKHTHTHKTRHAKGDIKECLYLDNNEVHKCQKNVNFASIYQKAFSYSQAAN